MKIKLDNKKATYQYSVYHCVVVRVKAATPEGRDALLQGPALKPYVSKNTKELDKNMKIYLL